MTLDLLMVRNSWTGAGAAANSCCGGATRDTSAARAPRTASMYVAGHGALGRAQPALCGPFARRLLPRLISRPNLLCVVLVLHVLLFADAAIGARYAWPIGCPRLDRVLDFCLCFV